MKVSLFFFQGQFLVLFMSVGIELKSRQWTELTSRKLQKKKPKKYNKKLKSLKNRKKSFHCWFILRLMLFPTRKVTIKHPNGWIVHKQWNRDKHCLFLWFSDGFRVAFFCINGSHLHIHQTEVLVTTERSC